MKSFFPSAYLPKRITIIEKIVKWIIESQLQLVLLLLTQDLLKS